MPRVLVLGASGFLGSALTQSLLRSGNYTVWGQTRSEAKAKDLAVKEVFPVVDDLSDSARLGTFIESTSIDVVVDTTQAYEQQYAIFETVVSVAKQRQHSLAEEKATGPKLGYVYTSGSMIYGSPSERVSDLSPVGNKLSKGKPAAMVALRPAFEQAILAAQDVLDVAIIRPGSMYGRDAWVCGTWWKPILEAKRDKSIDTIKIPSDSDATVSVLHVDDSAAAFLAAIDRIHGGLGNWPVFSVAAETVSTSEIIRSAKAAVDVKIPVEYIGTMGNVFLEAMSLKPNIETSRAKTVLGWQPQRTEFLLNTPQYIAAWEAACM